MSTFSNNHAIKSLLKRRHIENTTPHYLSLENITSKQQLKIKSSAIDTNNCLNRIFSAFNSLNKEFSLCFHLIDIFSRCLSFYHVICRNKESKTTYIYNLNKCVFNTSTDSKSVVVVSNTSIKNNVVTSITHVLLDLQSLDLSFF